MHISNSNILTRAAFHNQVGCGRSAVSVVLVVEEGVKSLRGERKGERGRQSFRGGRKGERGAAKKQSDRGGRKGERGRTPPGGGLVLAA